MDIPKNLYYGQEVCVKLIAVCYVKPVTLISIAKDFFFSSMDETKIVALREGWINFIRKKNSYARKFRKDLFGPSKDFSLRHGKLLLPIPELLFDAQFVFLFLDFR